MSDTCAECKHAAYLQDGTHECGIGDCPIKVRNTAIDEVLTLVDKYVGCSCNLEQYGEHQCPEMCQAAAVLACEIRALKTGAE